MLGALEAHLRGSIYDGYVRRLMVDGFGLPGAAGEGRFGAVEEWLECPSDDDDNGSSDDTDDSALQSWSIVQTVLAVVVRVNVEAATASRHKQHQAAPGPAEPLTLLASAPRLPTLNIVNARLIIRTGD